MVCDTKLILHNGDEMEKTQIERIEKMESQLDECAAVVREFSGALEKFEAIQGKIAELSQYYGSAEWFSDFDDSNSGKLPTGLKCGVLSEDAVFNLLADNNALAIDMLELVTKILKSN